MANLTAFQLSIDDSSPTISYFPLSDTLGLPDLLGGWNPYYTTSGFASTSGEVVNADGFSRHITAHDGAVISFSFFGTGIELFGNVTQSAFYELQLDGNSSSPITTFSPSDPTLLASFTDIGAGNHTLSLTVRNPTNLSSNFVAFDKAVIIVDEPNTINITSEVVDDTSIPFVGTWSFEREQSSTTFGVAQNIHASNSSGDFFTYIFNGSALSLSGFRDSDSGSYSVSIDGDVFTFDAQSSFSEPTTLFYMTGLSTNTHNLTVINLENKSLLVGSINVTTINKPTESPGSSASGLPRSTIAAIVVACVLGVTLLCLLVFLLWRRRRQLVSKRRILMMDDVLDSDIVIDASDEMGEHKPPSKTSAERREGSNNSRSFTLSLPIQQSQSRSSPQRDHSLSIQELPRSPSVSLVGTHAQNGSSGGGTDRQTAGRTASKSGTHPYSGAPLAWHPAPPEKYRPQPRQSIPQPPELHQAVQQTDAAATAATSLSVPAERSSTPSSPGPTSELSLPAESEPHDSAQPAHYSFLDISSHEGSGSGSGSGRDGQESLVHTSSSSSWGPGLYRMSQQTGRHRFSAQTGRSGLSQQSDGRPVSFGYAIEQQRNASFGLFRVAQLQSDAGYHLETLPARRTSEPTLHSISSELLPGPISSLSAFRPLPRIPQSPIITPPSAGPSRIEGLPALSLQTTFDTALRPAPAHLRRHREHMPVTASGPGARLQPPSNLGGRRRAVSTSASPTDSMPLTVSEIHFRDEEDIDDTIARALSPPASAPVQRTYASPFIMQTLRGEQPSIGSPIERLQDPVQNSSGASVERLAGPSVATGLERIRH